MARRAAGRHRPRRRHAAREHEDHDARGPAGRGARAARAWLMPPDYHLHLRPDTPGTDAATYFCGANVDRYRAAADERGIAELGCAEHVYRFAQALEVWRHPLWRETAVDDI